MRMPRKNAPSATLAHIGLNRVAVRDTFGGKALVSASLHASKPVLVTRGPRP
ncbi:MAG: hypothetical protein AMXMBFR64_26940 [Myxococcales bacterium]